MIQYVITILIFANALGLFFMYMTRDERNVRSRTEREYKMLIDEQNKNNK